MTSEGLNRMSVCERVLLIVTSSLTANFHVRSVVSRPHVITHAESVVCSIATAVGLLKAWRVCLGTPRSSFNVPCFPTASVVTAYPNTIQLVLYPRNRNIHPRTVLLRPRHGRLSEPNGQLSFTFPPTN